MSPSVAIMTQAIHSSPSLTEHNIEYQMQLHQQQGSKAALQ
jgi:hypothetical protein